MTEIIVDWGSTNFRAFLVRDGKVLDRRVGGGEGVLQLQTQLARAPDRGVFFSAMLRNVLGRWLIDEPAAPIFMCGAIGSREGWIDTGYVEAPAGIDALAAGLRLLSASERGELETARVGIVPGLATAAASGRRDIMRSEEVKSLGALTHLGLEDGVLCVPGTHCKWVVMRNGAITDFRSVMTGEIYNLLQIAGALAPLMAGEAAALDLPSFDQGLALAAEGEDLLADLWQVRGQKIRSPQPPAHLKSYLSGIMIGHESRHAETFVDRKKEIILLSDPGSRLESYRRALEVSGWKIGAVVESEAAVCTGMGRIIELCRRS
jgi:2-dehydro-3-deoxygalactonokinase